jgi:predicted Rossmann fold nucleotide-binding protein DprA/Smf involved in DNA uptake
VLLAVVGSVKVTQEQMMTAKAFVQGILLFYMPNRVISGGASGIDTLAENEALLLNLDFKKYLPEFPSWENGYKPRNLLIAQECTHLLCIRTTQSTTYGSGWTADRAEEMGKTVWRVKI